MNVPLNALGSRHVVTATPELSVLDAARRMAEKDVGCLVVVAGERPVGVVTDRDLVLRAIARGLDPTRARVEEVMSAPCVTVPDDVDPVEAASLMRAHRVRRLPIVARATSRLVGIVTLDDLVHRFGRASGEVAEVVLSLPADVMGG